MQPSVRFAFAVPTALLVAVACSAPEADVAPPRDEAPDAPPTAADGGDASSAVSTGSVALDGASVATTTASDVAAFAAAYADALCSNIGPCCQAASFAYDAAACTSKVASNIAGVVLSFTAADGGGTLRQDRAARLVASIARQASTCSDLNQSSAEATDFVRDLITLFAPTGTAATGAACAMENDCADAPGAAPRCLYGRCVAHLPATDGSPCDAQSSTTVGDCTARLIGTPGTFWCDDTLGTCQALGPLGSACSKTAACAPGTRCTAGVCSSLAAMGEPCAARSDCAHGLACVRGAQGSRACASAKVGGAPCKDSDECASFSCSMGICAASSLSTRENCAGSN